MTPWIEAGACALALWQGDVVAASPGWEETVELTLAAEAAPCAGLRLTLPDGVVLDGWTGKVRPADRRPYPLGPERLVRVEVFDDGSRVHDLHLPELREGDRVSLRLTRRWTAAVDYVWAPGLDGARYAELRLPKRATPELRGEGLQLDGRFAWGDALSDARLVLRHPWADRDAPALPPVPPGRTDGLPIADAVAALADLTWLPRGYDGPVARLVDVDARAALDDRGWARTVASLAQGGPDRVEIARWSPHPDLPPGPGALELPVEITDAGIVPWPHPGAQLPDGVWHAPSGQVDTPSTARPLDEPTVVAWTAEPSLTLPDRPTARALESATLRWRLEGRVDDPSPGPGGSPVRLPLPADTAVVSLDLPEGGTSRVTDDAVFLVLPPGATEVGLTLEGPLPALWGTSPVAGATIQPPAGASAATRVDRRGERTPVDATLRADGDRWWLAQLGELDLVSTPERHAMLLTTRVQLAGYPEPAVPPKARGLLTDLAAVDPLRGLLDEQVVVTHDLGLRPERPRKLLKARRTRAVTPLEAAAIYAFYAEHARMQAAWLAVRPIDHPLAGTEAPHGFDEALVRLRSKDDPDQVLWLDVGCRVCAPGELRPALVGAEARGPAVTTTPATSAAALSAALRDPGLTGDGAPPPPGVGTWEITEDGASVTWTVAGAEAWELRAWLADLPAEDRRAALVDAVAPGADPSTLALEGTDRAGAPITIRVAAEGGAIDPLAELLETPRPWIGTRTWIRPAPSPTEAAPDRLVAEGRPLDGASWTLRVEDGHWIETLRWSRPLAPEARAALADLRSAALRPPVPVDPEAPAPAE